VALRRGAKNAAKARMCEPCQHRRHTDCLQEDAVRKNRDQRELANDGFSTEKVDIPFCACYSTTDVHI
jgi:hypothetical protein